MQAGFAPLAAALKPRLGPQAHGLRVAATGHREFDPKTGAVIRATAQRLLADLATLVPADHIFVVSSLAEGADRLLSEAALDVGAGLLAYLPFEIEEYEETFDLAAADLAKAEFRRLLEAAESEQGGGVTILASEFDDRDDAYRQCALRMVEGCDLLIAVLSPSKGGSHTAAAVRQALDQGIAVAQIEPEHPGEWRLVLAG